jgi:hypothetical protein
MSDKEYLKDPMNPIVLSFWGYALLLFFFFDEIIKISRPEILLIILFFLGLNIWAIISLMFLKKKNKEKPN